jgi:hypothetical protein
MTFSGSDALFPPPAIERAIAAGYERQCRALCYGAFPSWPEVRARFETLRPLLWPPPESPASFRRPARTC